MVCKVCVFIALSIVCSGYALREIRLDDVDVHHISNPFIGRPITIPKNFWDTLVSCHIVFPDGNLYEAYPNSNIPHPNVRFGNATQHFRSCNIEFRGVGVDFSGVYQLLSTVRHIADNSLSLTRQRFNLTITLSDYSPPHVAASSIHPRDLPRPPSENLSILSITYRFLRFG